MSSQSSAAKTITVAAVLCVFCSVIVSSTVVALKPKQLVNADRDYKKNILMAAGLMEPGDDVQEAFKQVETVIVNLETGKIMGQEELEAANIQPDTFNQVKASTMGDMSAPIPAEYDVAGLASRSKYAKVFLTRDDAGEIKDIILYHRGKGLWSTMHGFIAVGPDTSTVKGFAYYSQGETPGLGGEVDNPAWKSQWVGKKIYDDQYKVRFQLAKGSVESGAPGAEHKVDGLSGATITGNGVTASMQYWFSDHGYGKFLENIRTGEI